MKITAKLYQTNAEAKRNLYHQMAKAEETNDMHSYFNFKAEYDALVKWFASLPKVSVSFMIGYRSYYREVVQIGKTFFHDSQKMTKGNGFRCVEVIPSITDKMREEMIADSYYY